jgi:hypothetical protein
MRSILVVLACSAGAAIAPAQVFIVDQNNGPGTHFTGLPEAVLAAPSGATLHVRPGQYSAFTLANKSLTIIGELSPQRPQIAWDICSWCR